MWRKMISSKNYRYNSKITQTNNLIRNMFNKFIKQEINIGNKTNNKGNLTTYNVLNISIF